jgi:hypothetical protein
LDNVGAVFEAVVKIGIIMALSDRGSAALNDMDHPFKAQW